MAAKPVVLHLNVVSEEPHAEGRGSILERPTSKRKFLVQKQKNPLFDF